FCVYWRLDIVCAPSSECFGDEEWFLRFWWERGKEEKEKKYVIKMKVGADENIYKVDENEHVSNVINATDTVAGNQDASILAQDALVHDDLAQVGKRVAFLVVECYVNNAWKKYGLVRVMMNSKGLCFFKFASTQGKNEVIVIPNVEDDDVVLHMVQFKPKKPFMQVVSKKNSASSSGMKKNSKLPRKVMSSANPFDALNTIEEDDELGSNGARQLRINELESYMIEGNLVLLGDDGKPIKPCKPTLPSSSNAVLKRLMIWLIKIVICRGKSSEDLYDDDDFDDPRLSDAQM
nr:hypothetical protein [Tanacetum cinerariifolium]